MNLDFTIVQDDLNGFEYAQGVTGRYTSFTQPPPRAWAAVKNGLAVKVIFMDGFLPPRQPEFVEKPDRRCKLGYRMVHSIERETENRLAQRQAFSDHRTAALAELRELGVVVSGLACESGFTFDHVTNA